MHGHKNIRSNAYIWREWNKSYGMGDGMGGGGEDFFPCSTSQVFLCSWNILFNKRNVQLAAQSVQTQIIISHST